MKRIKQIGLITIFFLVVIFFTPPAIAYEQEQLSECIASAKSNNSIEGVSESSIKNYCDCALDLIVDKGKEVGESGYECAIENFG